MRHIPLPNLRLPKPLPSYHSLWDFCWTGKKSFLSASCCPSPNAEFWRYPSFFPEFPETGEKGAAVHVHSHTGARSVLTASPNPTGWPWSPSSHTCSTWWIRWVHPGHLGPAVHKWWRRFVYGQKAPRVLKASDFLCRACSKSLWHPAPLLYPPCIAQFLCPYPPCLAQTPACSQLAQTHCPAWTADHQ